MPTQIIIAVFASGGFWAFIQFLISRRDKTQQRLDEIYDKMEVLSNQIDRNAAVLARTHILRFDDELLNGVDHSKEYFKQQLDDIDTYENFCDKHPDFQNSYAVMAAAHIKQTYQRLLDKGEFALKESNHD